MFIFIFYSDGRKIESEGKFTVGNSHTDCETDRLAKELNWQKIGEEMK
jgi:hypothetical protein